MKLTESPSIQTVMGMKRMYQPAQKPATGKPGSEEENQAKIRRCVTYKPEE